jgi:phosphoadenosine phosphosulfate reductase
MALYLSDDELRRVSDDFEKTAPEDVLRWAFDNFGERVALATGFGAEGCLLVSLIARIKPEARIFYLDTDLLFPETYALRDELETRYGVKFERRATALSLTEQAARNGAELWKEDPDECCRLRKVEPLKEVLGTLDAWITAIRRDQSPARQNAGIVGRDRKFGIVKINPLANWTSKEVWRFIFRNDVPYNRLHDRGFPSIGCRPCTAAVGAGADPRSGRWQGAAKTECGLHQ